MGWGNKNVKVANVSTAKSFIIVKPGMSGIQHNLTVSYRNLVSTS